MINSYLSKEGQNMLEVINSIIIFGFILALGFTLYYSVKFRRERQPDLRGLLQAKQNISMGIVLVLLSAYPILGISGTAGIIVGLLFLLMGLFNLFAGIRNHSTYQARLK
jgi:TRAP-type C4-dicarboxylate transport system permease small subunit